MLSKPLTALKGVGPAKAKDFARLGVETVYDLLTYLPRDYEDRSATKTIYEAEEGETVRIIATVFSPVFARHIRKGLSIYNVFLYMEMCVCHSSYLSLMGYADYLL